MSTTTRTIFWPVDLPRDVSDGFCYGWSAATKVCVAGVLDVDTEDDARDVVNSLDGVLVESCGSQVVVLGKSAELLGNTIFYYRHRSDSLRFYHLHLDDHDEHTPSPYFTLSQHDFTHRPLRRHDGLDDTSINHFNSAMLIESLVSPRSSKNRSKDSIHPLRRCVHPSTAHAPPDAMHRTYPSSLFALFSPSLCRRTTAGCPR